MFLLWHSYWNFEPLSYSATFLNSSLVTRSWLSSSSFLFGVNSPYLAVKIRTFGGRFASQLYTKENDVCPVVVLGVVLFAQRINGRSSSCLPLFVFRCLLITLMIDLLLDPACLLVYGYLGVAVLNCMFHFAKNLRVGVQMNWESLSHSIFNGLLNLQIIFLQIKVITYLSRTWVNESASIHLEK